MQKNEKKEINMKIKHVDVGTPHTHNGRVSHQGCCACVGWQHLRMFAYCSRSSLRKS